MYYQNSKKDFFYAEKRGNRKAKIVIFLVVVIAAAFFINKIFSSAPKSTKVSLKGEVVTKQKQTEKEELKKTTQPKKPVYLIAVGDIMLSRNVENKIKQNGFNYPFLKTKSYLQGGDIVFGNLECPIIKGPIVKTGQMVFRAPPGVEKALKAANFSIISLANNHTYNKNEEGMLKTFYYLKKEGIQYTGAGKNAKEAYDYTLVEKNGVKFAFLAYSDGSLVPDFYEANELPGIAFAKEKKMIAAVKKAKKEVDFVIISMHLGQEYKPTPNSDQKDFARSAIDSGADLVLGHHPHVIESIEKYKGKYIFYSLGNFIFDQMWSQETREGLMAKFLFKNNKVTLVETKAVLIENYSQPRILGGSAAERVLDKIKKNF